MPRYIFSEGKVMVQEDAYAPVERESKESSRGVLILARQGPNSRSGESTQDKECSRDN